MHQRAVALTLPAAGTGVVALHAQTAGGMVTRFVTVVVQP
jgi:hypothetical protein